MFKTFNKHSIFFSFFIILFISIVLVLGSYKLLIEHNKNYHLTSIEERYFPLARLIDKEYYNNGLTENLIGSIKDMGYEFSNDKNKIDKFFKKSSIKFLSKRENNLHMVALFTDTKSNYLYFQAPFDEFLIIDTNIDYSDDTNTITAIFSLILLTLLILAYTIYKKLLPLKKLKEEVKVFSKNKKEKFDFIQRDKKDEVSLLAYEFEDTIKEIRQLKEARNVFIRNIMHELKTPITKGKFLAELPQDEKNKELLNKVFFRLESLIEEFASIEEIIALKDSITKKPYLVDDVLDNAIDLLYLDENQVQYNTNNTKIDINFKLFSIAVKNLMDNGIKYSVNSKITIDVKKDGIYFISEGNQLEKPLEEYTKPFNHSTKNSYQQNKSFGLGLYIVTSILKAHDMRLSYKYENNLNYFIINITK